MSRHCDGPLSTESPETSETTNAPVEPLPTTSTNEHEHEQTEDAGPSPTESVGCEPHGDHW